MYLSAVEGVAVSPGKEVEEETETETSNEEIGMVQAVEKGMSKNEMA